MEAGVEALLVQLGIVEPTGTGLLRKLQCRERERRQLHSWSQSW